MGDQKAAQWVVQNFCRLAALIRIDLNKYTLTFLNYYMIDNAFVTCKMSGPTQLFLHFAHVLVAECFEHCALRIVKSVNSAEEPFG